jgi:Tfp pilus assembly protein PilF
VSVSRFGLVLSNQGKYEDAEAMHRRALEAQEKVLGHDYPHTFTSVDNLGIVLLSQGRYEEAEAMHRRALERCEELLGHEYPYTPAGVSVWQCA